MVKARTRPLQRSPRRHGERGAAAVELALILPLLVALLGGIVDFGFALNSQISASHAAREGARVAAVQRSAADGIAASQAAFLAPATGAPVVTAPTSCPAVGAGQATIVVSVPYDAFFLPPLSRSFTSQAVMRCGG